MPGMVERREDLALRSKRPARARRRRSRAQELERDLLLEAARRRARRGRPPPCRRGRSRARAGSGPRRGSASSAGATGPRAWRAPLAPSGGPLGGGGEQPADQGVQAGVVAAGRGQEGVRSAAVRSGRRRTAGRRASTGRRPRRLGSAASGDDSHGRGTRAGVATARPRGSLPQSFTPGSSSCSQARRPASTRAGRCAARCRARSRSPPPRGRRRTGTRPPGRAAGSLAEPGEGLVEGEQLLGLAVDRDLPLGRGWSGRCRRRAWRRRAGGRSRPPPGAWRGRRRPGSGRGPGSRRRPGPPS